MKNEIIVVGVVALLCLSYAVSTMQKNIDSNDISNIDDCESWIYISATKREHNIKNTCDDAADVRRSESTLIDELVATFVQENTDQPQCGDSGSIDPLIGDFYCTKNNKDKKKSKKHDGCVYVSSIKKIANQNSQPHAQVRQLLEDLYAAQYDSSRNLEVIIESIAKIFMQKDVLEQFRRNQQYLDQFEIDTVTEKRIATKIVDIMVSSVLGCIAHKEHERAKKYMHEISLQMVLLIQYLLIYPQNYLSVMCLGPYFETLYKNLDASIKYAIIRHPDHYICE